MSDMQADLFNIKHNYMDQERKCFFVAEVYTKEGEGELAKLSNKVKKVTKIQCRKR